jgi:hypothetical protein
VGTSGQLLSSTGAGIIWIAPPSSVFYKVTGNTALTGTPTTYLNTTSVGTVLSKAVTITGSLYFNTLATTSAITITISLLGGTSGSPVTLMTQTLLFPISTVASNASMPISWLDTTIATNVYKINVSYIGGSAVPQILANSNMVVANAQ